MRIAFIFAIWAIHSFSFAGQVISLQVANQLALEHNIELQTYPFTIRRQDALTVQAGVIPTPEISFEANDLLGTNDYGVFEQAELSLVFSQTVEMGGKRHHRLALSRASKDKLTLEYELAKLDVLAETSLRFYQLLELQLVKEILQDKVNQEQETLHKIAKLVEVGAVDLVDKLSVSLRLKRSKSNLIKLGSQIKIQKNRLSAMWQKTADFSQVKGDLFSLPNLPTKERLLDLLEETPDILHLLAVEREADQRLGLMKAGLSADVKYFAGINHKQMGSSQTVSVGVSVPLYFENPNKGRVDQALIDLQLSKHLVTLTKQKNKLLLVEHWQKMQRHFQQVMQLKNEILPVAKKLLIATSKSYARGSSSILQVIDAQQQWLDLRVNLIEESSQVFVELLTLERLTGANLTNRRGY